MLGRIYNHEIAYETYGQFVKICGRNLFNPTKQTYLDLGFYELPELEPKEGYHVEWRIATREVIPSSPEPIPEPTEEPVVNVIEDIIPTEEAPEVIETEEEVEPEPTPEPEPIIEEYIEAYYVKDPEPEDPEERKKREAKEREENFKKQFFKTSLGWIRKKATMKDGSVDNFLTDDLPLLEIGLRNGFVAKVIVYSTPDFTIDFNILDYQSYVEVTPQFIGECLQEKQQEFRSLTI